MSKKTWIIFVAAVVVLFGGLIFLSNKSKIDVSQVDTNKINPASVQSGDIADHVFGKADSKVVVIEYGDFQCPTCGSVYPNMKTVTDKYKDQIAFVFRNFPITTIHPNARAAAAAVEAAGLQDKYWDMYNRLYQAQTQWSSLSATDRTSYFDAAAKDLGLNLDTFNTDIASDKVNQKISYDQAVAKKINVTGTPTVYMNGKVVELDTLNDSGKLDSVVSAELTAKGIALPATTAK
ncbi:MAG: thioredoxin domain-containing protein [Candidatus Saccharimonadales bacterium]